MYPNKKFMEAVYPTNIGAVLNFIDNNGKQVEVVGDLYAIRLIMKQREVFWLRFPVEWVEEY